MTYNVTWYLISLAPWHYDNDRTSAWLGETPKNRCTSQSLPRDLMIWSPRLEQLEGFLTAGTVLIVKAQATGSLLWVGRCNCNWSAEHPQWCIAPKQKKHPWRLTAGRCHHGGLVQIMFLSKWVMAVGSMLIFVNLLGGIFSTLPLSKTKKQSNPLASCIHLAFALWWTLEC